MLSLKTNKLKKFGTIFLRVVMSSDEDMQSVMSIKDVAYFSNFCFSHNSDEAQGICLVYLDYGSSSEPSLKMALCHTRPLGGACNKYRFGHLPT